MAWVKEQVMFKVGQKVICVDDQFPAKDLFWIKWRPVSGEIYMIESMEAGYRGMGVRLAELKNPLIPVSTDHGEIQLEPTFHVNRFRSVTDISVFVKMLNDLVTV
jgi:hypothetical protein